MRTFTKQDSDNSDFILCPAGTMTATVTVVAFLGRHPLTWQGEERIKDMIGLQYETSETGPDGRPLSVSETMPFSTHEKSRFYSRLVALCGGREPPPGFNFTALPGMSCILTTAHVTRGDKVFCNVAAAGAIPKGLSGPVPSVPLAYYDITDPAGSCPFESLPGRFKRMAETALGEDYRPAPPPPPARPAAPAGAWSGTHSAQAPYAPAAPPPAWNTQPRRPAPPLPASPADGAPFNDDIPF